MKDYEIKYLKKKLLNEQQRWNAVNTGKRIILVSVNP